MKYKSLRGRAGLIAAAVVFILSGCQSGGSIQGQEGVDLLSQIQHNPQRITSPCRNHHLKYLPSEIPVLLSYYTTR